MNRLKYVYVLLAFLGSTCTSKVMASLISDLANTGVTSNMSASSFHDAISKLDDIVERYGSSANIDVPSAATGIFGQIYSIYLQRAEMSSTVFGSPDMKDFYYFLKGCVGKSFLSPAEATIINEMIPVVLSHLNNAKESTDNFAEKLSSANSAASSGNIQSACSILTEMIGRYTDKYFTDIPQKAGSSVTLYVVLQKIYKAVMNQNQSQIQIVSPVLTAASNSPIIRASQKKDIKTWIQNLSTIQGYNAVVSVTKAQMLEPSFDVAAFLNQAAALRSIQDYAVDTRIIAQQALANKVNLIQQLRSKLSSSSSLSDLNSCFVNTDYISASVTLRN